MLTKPMALCVLKTLRDSNTETISDAKELIVREYGHTIAHQFWSLTIGELAELWQLTPGDLGGLLGIGLMFSLDMPRQPADPGALIYLPRREAQNETESMLGGRVPVDFGSGLTSA